MCCNGHPYPICVSPLSRVALRSFSSQVSVLKISKTVCSSEDDSSGNKGDKKNPVEASGSSNGNKGKGSGKGKGGGNNANLSCPKCGDPCSHVETFVCTCNSEVML